MNEERQGYSCSPIILLSERQIYLLYIYLLDIICIIMNFINIYKFKNYNEF